VQNEAAIEAKTADLKMYQELLDELRSKSLEKSAP
jgi:hypothetical protein